MKNNSQGEGAELDVGTRLAYERTFLAHENTQMGWLRTALSLISFGFAIAKFFESLREKQGVQATLLSPQAVGILMIAIGVVSLTLASLQHLRAVKRLRARCSDLPNSSAGVMGALVCALGLLALVVAILR